MSEEETHHRNVFLKNGTNRFSQIKTNDRKVLYTNDPAKAKSWLEKYKPELHCISKNTAKTTIPRFVQDFIYNTWNKTTLNEDETFERPKKIKSDKCAPRWSQIKSEMFEREEIKKQENSFKKDRNYQEHPSSYFRSRSYKAKPKKEPIFDLAKETTNNGFPVLH